ncbi:MAG: hypothetical protein AB1715_07560 [Acidobacteriota bacterium]
MRPPPTPKPPPRRSSLRGFASLTVTVRPSAEFLISKLGIAVEEVVRD